MFIKDFFCSLESEQVSNYGNMYLLKVLLENLNYLIIKNPHPLNPKGINPKLINYSNNNHKYNVKELNIWRERERVYCKTQVYSNTLNYNKCH